MNPTPEQVAVWAREAAQQVGRGGPYRSTDEAKALFQQILVTRAMAAQAEADVEVCRSRKSADTDWDTSYWNAACENCAANISHNAPKVTT